MPHIIKTNNTSRSVSDLSVSYLKSVSNKGPEIEYIWPCTRDVCTYLWAHPKRGGGKPSETPFGKSQVAIDFL